MTQEELAALCGIVTSVVFSYFPGVKTWFDAKPANVKRLLQVGVAVVVAAVVFGLGCAGIVTADCSTAGALAMARLIIVFVVANQTAYAVTPRA